MMFKRLRSSWLAFLLGGALAAAPALASQNNLWSPTTGTVSGLTLTNNYNNALSSLASCNSGATAPANDQSAAAVKGQCWLDTSLTPNVLRVYDGAGSWLATGFVDAVNHIWLSPIGGGTATVVSASTVDLCASTRPQNFVTISSTNTITSFGSSCSTGQAKFLKFSGILQITNNNTSMILPNNGGNITTAVGDQALAVYLGGGNWTIEQYTRANGTALNVSATFTAAVYFNSVISPTALAANTNNWNPTGLANANTIRVTTSASGSVNITGLTAPGTNGQRLIIQNVNAAGSAACSSGTNCSIVLTSNDANSSAANRFLFDRPHGLSPQKGVTIWYDGTSNGWRLETTPPTQPVAGGTFKNAKLTNGGTPNNQLIYTADELVIEDINLASIRLASVSCTADITSSGAGGLDTGSVAQGQGYHFWMIFNPTTNTQNCLFSTASVLGSITFPSGYTHAARVGWDYVENAAGKRLNRILCYGRECQYVVTAATATASMPVMATGNIGSIVTPTWSALPVANFVPGTASVIDLVAVNGGAANSGLIVAPNNAYGSYISTTNLPPIVNIYNGVLALPAAKKMIIESANIYWAAASSANNTIYCAGWTDNL